MSEWQDISTAPKDKFILLFAAEDDDGCKMFVGSYAPTGETGPFGQFKWREQSGASIWAERSITHWMPLPTPPETDQ